MNSKATRRFGASSSHVLPWAFVIAALGCTGSHQTSSGGSGVSQSGGTGAASTTGNAAGSTGTTSGGVSGTGGSSSSGGSSGSTTGHPLVDGGYVFCALADAADAGPNGDGGPAAWICEPGTYFCDLSGNLGNCFQCRNDGDCVNAALPTYDPDRPLCDLASGLAGYQGFCQQCLGDGDCAGNPSGPRCDLDAGTPEPSILRLGFETCGPIPPALTPDCRGSYLHDGGCTPSFTCLADQDCAGLISDSQVPVPFCVNGSCTGCGGGVCPQTSCDADGGCGTLDGAGAALTCALGSYESTECGCLNDGQCGGLWPVCEGLDGGYVNSYGESFAVGVCGCDRDDQCGDAGLSCLHPPGQRLASSTGVCGVSCLDPTLPPCIAYAGSEDPICDTYAKVCEPCGSDGECQKQTRDLTGPYCRSDGACGCLHGTDCPSPLSCQPPFSVSTDQGELGVCAAPPPRCTPDSCSGALCDIDGGCELGVACATDFDCAISNSSQRLCDVDAGVCSECLDDSDCLRGGLQPYSTTCTSGQCSSRCVADADCAGNPLGSSCLMEVEYGSPITTCGCGTDRDCVNSPYGPHCDSNAKDTLYYGLCTCFSSSECASGEACQIGSGVPPAQCGNYCQSDTQCPPGFFCDPSEICRPRCDPGHGCATPDGVCDSSDLVGQNGQSDGGDMGPMWCYQCLTANDCDAGLGCLPENRYSCGACYQDADCRPGEVCLGGVCHASCDGGACPSGQFCDALGVAGHGFDVCYQCVGPVDCPDGEGCDGTTQTCGTCRGPTAGGGPFDCPPGAICSNYWSKGENSTGVCLQNCDERSCPAGRTCESFPSLTPDHEYCFGCVGDSDCADAGAGAWCDTWKDLTFTCQTSPP